MAHSAHDVMENLRYAMLITAKMVQIFALAARAHRQRTSSREAAVPGRQRFSYQGARSSICTAVKLEREGGADALLEVRGRKS
jgi:hypothetical protein